MIDKEKASSIWTLFWLFMFIGIDTACMIFWIALGVISAKRGLILPIVVCFGVSYLRFRYICGMWDSAQKIIKDIIGDKNV